MDQALQRLLELLDVEELEKNYFRAFNPPERFGRIFGGQVLGQALMAAGRTVEGGDRRVHSLQSYFLLGGDPEVPIMFEVDRIRDGRSFTTRRVRAFQHGAAIFALSASFHVDEDGPEHQTPMPDAPAPEDAGEPGPFGGGGFAMPFDIRWIDRRGEDPEPRQAMWVRTRDALPDDPLTHAALLAFVSDMGLVSTISQPHSEEMFSGRFMMASLDHMLWFHQPFRMDEWLLYTRQSPVAHGARGLAFGQVHTGDGRLVVSVAQEGLIRPRRQET